MVSWCCHLSHCKGKTHIYTYRHITMPYSRETLNIDIQDITGLSSLWSLFLVLVVHEHFLVSLVHPALAKSSECKQCSMYPTRKEWKACESIRVDLGSTLRERAVDIEASRLPSWFERKLWKAISTNTYCRWHLASKGKHYRLHIWAECSSWNKLAGSGRMRMGLQRMPQDFWQQSWSPFRGIASECA